MHTNMQSSSAPPEQLPAELPAELPESLIVTHILTKLPSSIQACTGKLVCRSAYRALQQQKRVVASHPDLPLSAVQQGFAATGRHSVAWARARAKAGDLAALQWLRVQETPAPWIMWANEWACVVAAQGGHLDVLVWLQTQGLIPRGADACNAAAAGGHLSVLRWLRAQDPPCPLDVDACIWLAEKRGHAEVLQWLRAQDPSCGVQQPAVQQQQQQQLATWRWWRSW